MRTTIDGAAAISRLKGERAGGWGAGRVAAADPDAVILDIRMPPTYTDEGLTAALRLRERHPGLGLLLLSTYAETPYAARLLEACPTGAGYLLKDHVDDITTLRWTGGPPGRRQSTRG